VDRKGGVKRLVALPRYTEAAREPRMDRAGGKDACEHQRATANGRPADVMSLRAPLVIAACAVATVGCTSNSTSPSATASGSAVITFASTTENATVNTYTENGYSISTSGGWQSITTYGNPAPFIEFVTPGGRTGGGSIQVFAINHVSFTFQSVDVYSSITPIPYTITGVRDFSVVFTMSDSVPNTFGAFRTVTSTHPTDVIDTLTIQLTSPLACCSNPVGVDNIRVLR
jgi:hypothetical protein